MKTNDFVLMLKKLTASCLSCLIMCERVCEWTRIIFRCNSGYLYLRQVLVDVSV